MSLAMPVAPHTRSSPSEWTSSTSGRSLVLAAACTLVLYASSGPYAWMLTVIPVCFLNAAAALRRPATWDCLKVHMFRVLLSPEEPDEPPHAASGVSESTVATAAAASLDFGFFGEIRAKGM